jgi:(1->4)-alpha-D-glucan 1-alpha-D-glucosylmutase
MEDPLVFDEVHRFVLELVHRGAATGLRVDHVDGLFAPGEYLHRLQTRCAEAAGERQAEPFFIVVEKVLGAGEQLSRDWPVAGTTGYEFAAVVNNLFVDRRNERALTDIAKRFVRDRREQLSFADLAYRSKKTVMHETMSGDINSLGHQLNRFSERNRHFRDFTLYSLISTLKEVIACFPVYRTYVHEGEPVSEHDRRYIVEAVRAAKRRAPGVAALVFDFIQRLLLKQTPAATPVECEERARFIGKFQQITSPIAAKGIEDTALYIYNRLLSLNEVGADPTRFGMEPQAVHDWLAARQRHWPAGLSATATHDTKRGEDLRARLNVLSELPGPWKDAVLKWRAVNRRFKTGVDGALAPDPNEEYLLYQTLVGAWPFGGLDETFVDRIDSYMVKALRESKVHTSWLSPDDNYESAVRRFVRAILDPQEGRRFLELFAPFQSRVAELGVYNSLSQLVIKIAAPGIPDFYQGTEFWDLNLVDPDNRHPVDYARRREALDALDQADVADLLAQRADGRIKMFVMRKALAARRRHREAFEGEYTALPVAGPQRDSIFAFARGRGTARVVVCVPRLLASVIEEPGRPPVGGVWNDTRVEWPDGGAVFRDIFTDRTVDAGRGARDAGLMAGELFDRFPVALLIPS